MIHSPDTRLITCGIIEKAALHRSVIKLFIDRMPELQLAWECEFQESAYRCFEECVPDVLFLQLGRIPVELDSLLRHILTHHKGIIITTGFNPDEVTPLPFQPLDFLQKPVSFERFSEAIERYKGLNTNM
jgi:two-component system LytT family response regulator